MQVTVLGQARPTRPDISISIEDKLQASDCALEGASHAVLHGVQAAEGLCLRPLPRQEDVSQQIRNLCCLIVCFARYGCLSCSLKRHHGAVISTSPICV